MSDSVSHFDSGLASPGPALEGDQKRAQPLVSVVLLSYARPEYFGKALQSVVDQSYRNLEIIVVDNRSEHSDRIAAVAARYPQVRFIANPTNLGFTGGMNQGIRACGGDYIFLTEDDLVLDPDCVNEFVARVGWDHPRMLLSGLILNERDGTIWAAGGKVDLGPTYQMTVFGQGEPDSGQYSKDFDVNYISGSMVFASATLLKSLGGFREDFFMYSEDVELCFRATACHCTIKVVPSARAAHFEPGKSTPPKNLQRRKIRNVISLYLLHARPTVVFTFLVRQLGAIALGKGAAHTGISLQAMCAAMAATPRLLKDRRALRAKSQEISGQRR